MSGMLIKSLTSFGWLDLMAMEIGFGDSSLQGLVLLIN